MVITKNGRKISMNKENLLLFALAFGVSFAVYNFATFWPRNQLPRSIVPKKDDGSGQVDPVIPRPEGLKPPSGAKPKFHVAVTASDGAYSQWQCRIMYYWYNKFKDQAGSDMGGFTRVLHSGRADNLIKEIPTFVVDPLPKGLDKGYVVLNRPWAFQQWLEKGSIEEEYIYMAEPDHILVKPLPNLAYGIRKYPAAYPFFYIKPAEHEKIVRKFFPKEKGPITFVDPIGNSPVIITKSLLKEIVPTWVNVSMKIKNDPEADQAFGWVQEMYGYAIASALHGVKHILYNNFMVQPPFDRDIGESYIIHYTYGNDFNMKGELRYGERGEWHFDKRSYLDGPPPKNISLPPPGAPESVIRLIQMMNEAMANIPGWENL